MKNEKHGLLHLAKILERAGVEHLVVSPGSRNAPLVSIFSKTTSIQVHIVVDERSAAFVALGIAQQTQKVAALLCTSGSAVLNYAPAISEAYYQRIPLVVLTADRPVEWVDQSDGQTIRQQNIFANYVRKSVQLPQSINHPDELWLNDRLISEALIATEHPVKGPVHINIPIREPLYGFSLEDEVEMKYFTLEPVIKSLSYKQIDQFAQIWNTATRKMILVGQCIYDERVEQLLKKFATDATVVVLTETLSNVHDKGFISCIDRCLGVVGKEAASFEPQILLTFGGPVVSKRVKSFLRSAGILHHWHIDSSDIQSDTYQHLSKVIPMGPCDFLQALHVQHKPGSGDFAQGWHVAAHKASALHDKFLGDCRFNDLKIFELLLNAIPSEADVQLANSTPIRYAQLFADRLQLPMFSNRGTSGIDGSVSTAVGAAMVSGRLTVMISGDLGFFYDSNALWNSELPSNLRIVVVNNEGGGIFRFLPGPDTTGLLETHFEARHQLRAEGVSATFGLNYFTAQSQQELLVLLPAFFGTSDKCCLLEILSPAEDSASTLRAYFTSMKA